MLTKWSGFNPKGPFTCLEKEKDNFCVAFTYSIKRVREIRKFHVAVVQRRLRNVEKSVCMMQGAKLFFCQSKQITFVLFVVAVAKTPSCCDL